MRWLYLALSIDGMDLRVAKIGLICSMKTMNCQRSGEFIDYAVLTLIKGTVQREGSGRI